MIVRKFFSFFARLCLLMFVLGACVISEIAPTEITPTNDMMPTTSEPSAAAASENETTEQRPDQLPSASPSSIPQATSKTPLETATAVKPTPALPKDLEALPNTTPMNNVILIPRLNLENDTTQNYDELVVSVLITDLSNRLGLSETAVSLERQENTEIQLANPCGSMQNKQDEPGSLSGGGLTIGQELTFTVGNDAYRYVVAGAKAYFCS